MVRLTIACYNYKIQLLSPILFVQKKPNPNYEPGHRVFFFLDGVVSVKIIEFSKPLVAGGVPGHVKDVFHCSVYHL